MGAILYEYYSGTELVGRTSLGSEEWLAHPGSVGRPEFGRVHIVSEDGERELPPGQPGVIYFSGGGAFEYHKDPAKTRKAYNARGWATYGDIGYLDADGYLYLTDRLSNMIVSGGVNIYPQEAENLLCTHPAVADVARDRRAGRRVRRGGQGRGATARTVGRGPGAGAGADRLLPRPPVSHQVPQERGLLRGHAAHRDRQAAQAAGQAALLAGRGIAR